MNATRGWWRQRSSYTKRCGTQILTQPLKSKSPAAYHVRLQGYISTPRATTDVSQMPEPPSSAASADFYASTNWRVRLGPGRIRRCRETSLNLNASKPRYGQSKVTYMGHAFSPQWTTTWPRQDQNNSRHASTKRCQTMETPTQHGNLPLHISTRPGHSWRALEMPMRQASPF